MYVYSITAIGAAKSNAKRLRDQDGGTLDLHRQSLRQHGLLNDRHSVSVHSTPVRRIEVPVPQPVTSDVSVHEEAIRAEARRRKEEALAREAEEIKEQEKDRYSLWNWLRGK